MHETHTPAGKLRRKLSAPVLALMIIAASAPLTVLAGGVPTNFAVSGILGIPIAYLILGAIIVIFACGYGAMSSQIPKAGAFYAYISAGLGTRQGIAAAILALVAYNMMQIGLYGIFGFSLANLITILTGINLPWWLAALAGWALVGALGIREVDLSAKVLSVLVSLEFLVVIVVSFLSLTSAPEGISTQTLQPSQFFTPGIGVLLAFGIAAFMGFESGAIYAEETKDPRRTVSRATYAAVITVALFYAFSSWALAMGIGPSRIVEESAALGPDLVFTWLAAHSQPLASVAQVLFVFSLIAALLAFHNVAARYFQTMGATGVLPSQLGRLSPAGAPAAGSLVQSALALLVIGIFAVAGASSELGVLYPVITLFTWFTNAAAFGLVFLLAVTSVAIAAWFYRHPQGFNIWNRLIAPAISTVTLTLVALLILWNFDLMIDSDGPLVFIMPGIILGSGILGAIWGEFLRRAKPETYHTASIQLVPEPTNR